MDLRFVIPAPATTSVPVAGADAHFPVHRIYCVGRNYAEHAQEMGHAVDREVPTFFMKPADAAWPRAEVPYPPGTTNLHHEVEWVVALRSGGRDLDPADALDCVFGYAIGLDLTRRDLQAAAKAKGNPWDTAKGFDASAPIGAIVPASIVGHPRSGELALTVNGVERQRADIATMIFKVPEILTALSRLYELAPGDLVFTGTPAGVAPLVPGDAFEATFPGLPTLRGSIRG
jgi:fumarylpyruvate hydrolase